MSSSKGGSSGYASLLDLEEQFTFYSSYHSNPKNKAIHLLFVWPILWTGLALLASFCPLGSLPPGVLEHLPFRDVAWNLHLGTPLTLAYVFVYLAMDPIAGGLGSVMVMSCYVTSNMWVADGGSAALAGAVHLAGWVAQVYGHSVYERRAPALVDNLFQAFLAAPLFVLCEVLFEFRYKADMQKRVKAKALLNIQEYHASNARRAAGQKED